MTIIPSNKKILAMWLFVVLVGVAQPTYGMNKLKGWVNQVKPGTFSTDEDKLADTKAKKKEISFSNADVKILIQLKSREADLEKREKEFSKRTGELKLLSQQIEQKLDQMRSLAGKIEQVRNERKDMDKKDITRMVKYYETMSPDSTAVFINQMDRITAMQILMKMNPRKASAVMQLLDPKVAVEITERVTRFKKNRSDLVGQ